jgi:uncharacterized cupin superfamily protein
MERPACIVNADELPWERYDERSWDAGASRDLTPAMSRKDGHLGVRIVRIDPGSVSAAFHYHLQEDEFCLVLAGRALLRLGDATHEVGKGDAISFPRGERVAHQFYNHGTEPVDILMVGENHRHEVVFYPDSGQWLVRGLGGKGAYVPNADYWDGEPDPPLAARHG